MMIDQNEFEQPKSKAGTAKSSPLCSAVKRLVMLDFDREPDFINELGVKWWKDESTTRYAQKENVHGIKLDIVCFAVEEPDGRRTRVLVNKQGEIIEEDQTLDGIGVKIDIRKMLKRDSA